MAAIFVTNRNGGETRIDPVEGESLMEVIVAAGFDEMLAICGGCLSCATCHVYVDPGFTGTLPPVSDDESELLDSSDLRIAASRLACQIPFGGGLDGLRVTIAPEG